MSNHRIDLVKCDFRAQFQRCVEWNDPEQWEVLAILYYQSGYNLNALHCFERADACRRVLAISHLPVAAETEIADVI